jgi:hypothetical protein
MAQSGLLDFIQGIAVLRMPLTVCSDDDEGICLGATISWKPSAGRSRAVPTRATHHLSCGPQCDGWRIGER